MCHILQSLAQINILTKSPQMLKHTPHRSSQVIGMLCFAAASVIGRVQRLCVAASCSVLFHSAHDLSAKTSAGPTPEQLLHRSILVSCGERPSRCYTELPLSPSREAALSL